MTRILKKLHRATSAVCGHRAAYAAMTVLDAATSLTWRRPLIAAEGNHALGEAYPKLVSPEYRMQTSLSPTPLCLIMSDAGSDKGLRRHNYTQLYDAIFASRRPAIKRLFELGVGTNNVTLKSHMGKVGRPGASLRGWREYFPNASIFAADIDRDILFSEERIETFFCDQTDEGAIAALWANAQLAEPFDVIIDDGLHRFFANRCFIENSLHKLRPGGMFFVEDVLATELGMWADFLGQLARRASGLRWAVVRLHHPFNKEDNNVILVQSGAGQ